MPTFEVDAKSRLRGSRALLMVVVLVAGLANLTNTACDGLGGGATPAVPDAAPAGIAPFAAGGLETVTIPSGIASNCSVDVTAALLQWIGSVPDGATLRFGTTACYRIDGTLSVANREGLVFDGNGSTFKAGTDGNRDRRHWQFLDDNNIVVCNMIVRGANPHAGLGDAAYDEAYEFQHAFYLGGVDGAVLQNLQAYDVWGDFVYLGKGVKDSSWSRNVIVQDSHFERNGRQGMSLTGAEDVVIRRNYLGDVRRTMFDIEPPTDTWGARRVEIRNNTTGRGRLMWLASGGQGFDVNDITIADNVMQEQTGVPIINVITPRGGVRGPITITGNSFLVGGSPQPGISCTRCSNLNVRSNRMAFSPKRNMTAIGLADSSHVRVTGNAFTGAVKVVSMDAACQDVVAQPS